MPRFTNGDSLSPIVLQDRAIHEMESQDWDNAVQSYAILTHSNPYSASYAFNFGYALHKVGRYAEAIAAFEQAILLGFGWDNKLWRRYVFTEEWWRSLGPNINAPQVMIARAQARLGQKEDALQALGQALQNGFADEPALHSEADLDPLRDDPGFHSLLGIPPADLSREERWNFDIDHLARRLEQIHYDLYRNVSRDAFHSTIQTLKAQVPVFSDERIVIELTRLIACIGDGHTGLGWPHYMRDFPLFFALYSDGLFVRKATMRLAEVVGGRVVRLGEHTADEILVAVAPLCSTDNAMNVKKLAVWRAANPAVLVALGMIREEERDQAPLVVEMPGGTSHTVVLSQSLRTDEPWPEINGGAQNPLPGSLNVHDTLWFEHLPETNLVYCQCNAIANAQEESFAAFFQRLLAFIETHDIDYLALDLRNNSGGDSGLNSGLVHALLRSDHINRRGHLFVLIGRHTFSAAQNLANTLERETEALFVGEPSGSRPNFVGQSTRFTLPCSGLPVSCSSLYHQNGATSCDFRTWIEPDIVAEFSSRDAANNRDPGMEAIRAEILRRL